MICAMLLFRVLIVVAAFGATFSCSRPQQTSTEPKTAKEKQLQAMKASGDPAEPNNANWKMWRYTGDRAECYYAIGRRCFKTAKAACDTTPCRGSKCDVVGAGPAMVSCKADAKPGASKTP
jgi:hypothetical protein